MSYQVLARKWRPKIFREMVGQEHVLKALINALDHDRLHHAYLFTGTRGVGKTTIARILAKCLNCEVGVSSEPCGSCSACSSIAEGRFIDLIEVDAASRTKVEDTRELLENVQYAPTNGRYKVYLIDEVHMLSGHSFNALLKTLEEPPPHVKFLLATTDPQKLPATILSRCLQFNLKNMTPERIVEHLKMVLEQEMVSFEEPALWLLGRSADGSMRDAMSLTDQAIAFGSGKLIETDVRAMLGTVDQSAVLDIINALLEADGAQVLAAVAQLAEHAPDYSSALEEILTLLHRVAVIQAVPDAMDNGLGDQATIQALAAKMPAEDLQLFYQLGLNGRRDLPMAPDPRSGFEMVLLRMLAFKPAGVPQLPQGALNNSAVSSVASSATPSAVASGTAATQQPTAAVAASPAPVPEGAPQAAKKSEAAAPVVALKESLAEVEVAAPVLEPTPAVDAAPGSAPVPPEPQVAAVRSSVEPLSAAPRSSKAPEIDIEPLTLASLTPNSWLYRFDDLGFGGVVGSIASHCILQELEGDKLLLVLDQDNATLFNENHSDRIQAHLSVTLNAPIKLLIEQRAVTSETPAALRKRLQNERKQKALSDMQADPTVQALLQDFDGVLDTESVIPV